MPIIRAPGTEFLFTVCTNPQDAYIIKYNHDFASIQEVHEIMGVCQEYLEMFTQEKIDEINQQRPETEHCKQNQQKDISDKAIYKFQNGNVYLMFNGRNRYTKIGFTSKKPEFRERTLQSEEPEVKLIASFKGSIEDEARLHILFQHKRIRGEWFDLSEEDVAVIKNYFVS